MTIVDVCPQFGDIVAGGGYDAQFVEYALDVDTINALLSMPADESFWVGYENGGFEWPPDVRPVLTLTLVGVDGDERWIDVFWSEKTPERYYALPFPISTPYADSNGEYFGTHPCAAVVWTAVQYTALIAELRAA